MEVITDSREIQSITGKCFWNYFIQKKLENLEEIYSFLDTCPTKIKWRCEECKQIHIKQWVWSSSKSLPTMKSLKPHRLTIKSHQTFTGELTLTSLKLFHKIEKKHF